MAATGLTATQESAFRRSQLTPSQREQLLKPFLPDEPDEPSKLLAAKSKAKARATYKSSAPKRYGPVKTALHFFIYHTIALLFSVFFRFRRAYRLVRGKIVELLKYHHRTPEFIAHDVKNLEKLPKHLSVIVDYQEDDEHQGTAGLEGLVNDVCEIAAWAASAGIPFLSVYERTGALKNYLPQTHSSIWATLEAYFGPRRKPTLSLRAPHLNTYSPPNTPPQTAGLSGEDPLEERQHLTVLLLSEHDGRDTIVDLTRTLAEMAQKGDVQQEQINADLIDAQLSDHVSSEPDLLILFSPTVQLKGYPPWQLRLTEIFHLPDNKGVNYQVFLRALYNFAKVEMRLGR
ncbi:di-trans,poly-cis-decaprenylcistransferas-like protein [Dothidotthia symphoricarpi CBS 119687]|uniref:ditrans,polycis-polyprenyl diphosphate synthase [(2E,6E)-farnesyldiphosphate specific] n=1 Tax=Dothidotthia symphoricarpi CBS 119687 TaxID=1392245 RepID=A0A6A6AM87_9PLEO|nr:di-trans,poly-cis-decaprenylcistransferas-like protein [Dothidotthia symphoricarpi CBS 119687]KAF2132676.1 di-trans,poly-cis-decaprenylcistransferas-like protein [Dothidotthia symphoricarpi CBS 119687]